MDFTLAIYKRLIEVLLDNKYEFVRVEDYLSSSEEHCKDQILIMRHDVDRLPENAKLMAELENRLGVRTTYYFRTVPDTLDFRTIDDIKSFGHEIGYHYENLSRSSGDYEKAIINFKKSLEIIRKIYPVKTICMHGSPLSKWDNRELWDRYNYEDFGIIGEPYIDINFNEVFYLTDTGRMWNGQKISVRDKVIDSFDIEVNSTQHLIGLVKEEKLPKKIMINTHPHRWFDFGFQWGRELIVQNLKNLVKYFIVQFR